MQYYFHTKDELLLGSLPYLAERLANRIQARLRALGSPPAPRAVVAETLLAVLPTDEESRQIRTTYDAFYALVLTQPGLADRYEARDPDALERFLADQLGRAQQAREVAGDQEPRMVAAGLLALTNGLGASVIGGQRSGAQAAELLTYHLGRVFRPVSVAGGLTGITEP